MAHPEKTKIIYCKDGLRKDDHDHTKFTFLGYEFRARLVQNSRTKQFFVGFTPAVSTRAKQSMRYEVRSWKLKSCATMSLEEVAARINPVVHGWMNYYGRYCRSALDPIRRQIEIALSGWVMRKYKTLHRRRTESLRWLSGVRKAAPKLFAHWTLAPIYD